MTKTKLFLSLAQKTYRINFAVTYVVPHIHEETNLKYILKTNIR